LHEDQAKKELHLKNKKDSDEIQGNQNSKVPVKATDKYLIQRFNKEFDIVRDRVVDQTNQRPSQSKSPVRIGHDNQ
jgi:hypothetical protein